MAKVKRPYRTGGTNDLMKFWSNIWGTLGVPTGRYNNNASLGNWFKQQYGKSDYLDSLSDEELGALLEDYWYRDNESFGMYTDEFDYASALADIKALENSKDIALPEAPDYGQIYKDAQSAINTENEELLSLLDNNLNRTLNTYNKMYGQEMSNLNQMYNDYARQLLSRDYMKNSQLMGSVQSSLDRSRQNALEAGASAGLRLASNINTILSTQNKQTQQSLETANNLAQQMLNQRQAAMGLRSDYNNAVNNAYNQDTSSRIGLKQGTTERINNYANAQFGTQQSIYENALNNRDTYYDSAFSENPFSGSYSKYQQGKQYKNKYGY